MLEYYITAESRPGGEAVARAKETELPFDAAAESGTVFPNPAELFLSSFAACVLKNVERYSHILHIPYSKAAIAVKGWRRDVPPAMIKVDYELTVWSPEEDRRIDLLHRNIEKFGTIYNTVSASCEVTGKMIHIREGESK